MADRPDGREAESLTRDGRVAGERAGRIAGEQAALRRVATLVAETGDGVLHVPIHDDGHGGADFGPGSGLAGLKDRIEALSGRLSLHSPPGAGTTVDITLPLDDP